MNLREAGQVIRDTVRMSEILNLYGYRTRHGFMVCPFHGDRDASLKVYDGKNGWHCFGCGRGGSVIDFVMEHEGCDYRTAVQAIDKALGLNLMRPTDPLVEERRKRIQDALDQQAEEWLHEIDWIEECLEGLLTRDLHTVQDIEAIPAEERTAQQWTRRDMLLDEMEWLEWKKTECNKYREEVRAWRREKRRPTQDRGGVPSA